MYGGQRGSYGGKTRAKWPVLVRSGMGGCECGVGKNGGAVEASMCELPALVFGASWARRLARVGGSVSG